MRLAVLTCLAACTVVAGCGERSSAISVQVRVTTYDAPSHKAAEHRFTLGCETTSGSLPLAARICADIARHPVSMLSPGRARSVCGGLVFGPVVAVSANRSGHKSSFGGQPGCGWPGGTALAIYWAAANRDTRTLAIFEPRLRCDDDPALLAMPSQWDSIAACTHGRWTPRSERLIRLATTAPQLAALQARALFPHDIGTRRCAFNAGGPTAKKVEGLCGVGLKKVWSTPEVTFAEQWSRSGGRTWRHQWRVRIDGRHPALVSQQGSVPPQMWR
jgi:hypothetical protein